MMAPNLPLNFVGAEDDYLIQLVDYAALAK